MRGCCTVNCATVGFRKCQPVAAKYQYFMKRPLNITSKSVIILHPLYWKVSDGECLDCNLHSSVSVAICAAVLVYVSTGPRDVCSMPVWLVLHSSFSHPKADVTKMMGSGRLPWRPTGGRLKVSPPRSAQQMEAEVIICCSVHLLTPHTSMPTLAHTASWRCKDASDQLLWKIKQNVNKCFTPCKPFGEQFETVCSAVGALY